MKRFFVLGLLMGLVAPTTFDSRADFREEIPFIPTPIGVVDRMLELAGVKKGDVLYDLGSGGRSHRHTRSEKARRPRRGNRNGPGAFSAIEESS